MPTTTTTLKTPRIAYAILGLLSAAVVYSTAAPAAAQILTTPNYGQPQRYSSRPSGYGYDSRYLAPSTPRYAPQTMATRYAPVARPPVSRQSLSSSPRYRQANYLPPPPGRVYRGQEPADLRPRLSGGSGEPFIRGPSRPNGEFRGGCQPYPSGRPIASERYYGAPYSGAHTGRGYSVQYPYSGTIAPPANAYRPVLPISSMPSRYYVGQGSIGQPKVYVPGQPLRNFLRYITL